MVHARSIHSAPLAVWRPSTNAVASPHRLTELPALPLSQITPLTPAKAWRHNAARQGRWYLTSADRHIEYGSIRERDLLMWVEYEVAPTEICHSPVSILPGSYSSEPGATSILGYRDRSDQLTLVFDEPSISRCPETFARLAAVGVRVEPIGSVGPTVLAQVAWLAAYRAERYVMNQSTEALLRQFASHRIKVSALVDRVVTSSGGGKAEILANVYSQGWRRLLTFEGTHHPSSPSAEVSING